MVIETKAYAKINLSLDIVGKRADGYHLLRTVMQSVSLYDTVSAEKSGEIFLSCETPGLPLDEKNTAVKAARVFFSETGLSGGVRLRMEKRIPMQAGLGGGSADAAAVLHLLNRLYETGFSVKELCRMGEKVGADVPFCVFGGTALAEGIGETLRRLEPMPPCEIVIVRPETGVSTAEAYAEIDRRERSELVPETTEAMLRALAGGSVREIGHTLFNAFDFVSASDDRDAIKAKMCRMGALGVCMSGSGSAVFGLFGAGDPQAEECRRVLARQYGTAFLCRPVFE